MWVGEGFSCCCTVASPRRIGGGSGQGAASGCWHLVRAASVVWIKRLAATSVGSVCVHHGTVSQQHRARGGGDHVPRDGGPCACARCAVNACCLVRLSDAESKTLRSTQLHVPPPFWSRRLSLG